jgi:hypothetical protein
MKPGACACRVLKACGKLHLCIECGAYHALPVEAGVPEGYREGPGVGWFYRRAVAEEVRP